jgi:hypothetical protein
MAKTAALRARGSGVYRRVAGSDIRTAAVRCTPETNALGVLNDENRSRSVHAIGRIRPAWRFPTNSQRRALSSPTINVRQIARVGGLVEGAMVWVKMALGSPTDGELPVG